MTKDEALQEIFDAAATLDDPDEFQDRVSEILDEFGSSRYDEGAESGYDPYDER